MTFDCHLCPNKYAKLFGLLLHLWHSHQWKRTNLPRAAERSATLAIMIIQAKKGRL